MRLLTWKAASRAAAGKDVAPYVAEQLKGERERKPRAVEALSGDPLGQGDQLPQRRLGGCGERDGLANATLDPLYIHVAEVGE